MPRLQPLIVALVVAWSPSARAAESVASAQLMVHRSADAQACASEAELAARLRPHVSPAPAPLRLIVNIDRTPGGYAAEIRASGSREGVRALDIKGSDCSSLEDALLVSLALTIDPTATPNFGTSNKASATDNAHVGDTPDDQQLSTSQELASPPPAEDTEKPAPEVAPTGALKSEPLVTAVELGLGAGAAFEALPATAAAIHGVFRVELAPWTAEIAGYYLPPVTSSFRGGDIVSDMLVGQLGFCRRVELFENAKLRVSGCALGALHWRWVEGQGFDVNRQATQLAGSWGPALRVLGRVWGPLHWEIFGNGLIATSERTFSVDGLGDAWTTQPVMLSAGFHLIASIW